MKKTWHRTKAAWAAAKAAELRALASNCTYDPFRHDPARAGPAMRKARNAYLIEAVRFDGLAERFKAKGL